MDAAERHVTLTMGKQNGHGGLRAWELMTDTEADVTPYTVTSFWRDRPPTDVVYEYSDLTKVLGNDSSKPQSPTVSPGIFKIMTNPTGPEPANVASLDYTVRTNWRLGPNSNGHITDGGPEDHFLLSVMNILTLYGNGGSHEASLFDLLAFIAAGDARADGRDADAELVTGLVPFMDGGAFRSIDRQLGMEIVERIFTSGIAPLVIPVQDTNPVRKHVDPIGKLANKITDPRLFNAGGAVLDVTGEGERREVTTWVALASDDLEGVDVHGHLIENIDREIMGAFASHWTAGNRTVTLNQIATGTGFRRPSAKKAAMIEAHVDKLARIWADVDATAELRGREIFDGDIVDGAKFGGHLLEVRKSEVSTVNGKRVVGYQILQPPIVMQHAALTGQLVTTPTRLMNVGEGSDTDLNVVLRNRMATRIQRMRNDRKRSRRVRYIHSAEHPERPGLFEVAGVNLQDRDAKARAVDFVSSCLRAWADMGWISGFTEVRDSGRGRPIVGVDIRL